MPLLVAGTAVGPEVWTAGAGWAYRDVGSDAELAENWRGRYALVDGGRGTEEYKGVCIGGAAREGSRGRGEEIQYKPGLLW